MQFQLLYLARLINNIPDGRLYEKQLEGYNSAGWILGHLYVETEDVVAQLDKQERFGIVEEEWRKWFKNTTGRITNLRDLPNKKELWTTLQWRYEQLGQAYLNLEEAKRQSAHPSILLKEVLTTFDAWFAHHLTTHLGIHCGNLVVWKKLVGIPVNGF